MYFRIMTCREHGDSGRVARVSAAVLVTGGSRGIGASIARAFAERGDRVAVHYGSARTAAAAVRDSLPGGGHVVVQADMADADAVRDMVDAAADGLGGLDVLVNNAGIYTSHPVLETGYEQWQAAWRDTLGVNLIGAANATWCAVRHMTGRGGGRIVNVGSRGAYRGEPANPAYGASKAGLQAFGQSLAVALAPHGITVASVAPGFVETDMAADVLAGPAGDGIRAQSPFNRVATPQEIAAAVVFLASPAAAWASGAVLDLNGASYLRLHPEREPKGAAVSGLTSEERSDERGGNLPRSERPEASAGNTEREPKGAAMPGLRSEAVLAERRGKASRSERPEASAGNTEREPKGAAMPGLRSEAVLAERRGKGSRPERPEASAGGRVSRGRSRRTPAGRSCRGRPRRRSTA
jgi:3-oxoacyl-[acyl-carrier protein] reductase